MDEKEMEEKKRIIKHIHNIDVSVGTIRTKLAQIEGDLGEIEDLIDKNDAQGGNRTRRGQKK